MKYILILLLFHHLTLASEINSDVPDFLEKVTKITKDRWEITIDREGLILIRTKENVAGQISGNFSVRIRDKYSLEFKFKVVDKPTEKEIDQKINELKDLRKKATKMKHLFNKGYYRYSPEEKEEWALVLKIKQLEREIRSIPEYSYKSVYFSNEDPWWFSPNKKDAKALQYSKDIEEIYKLLKKNNFK